MTDHDTTTTSTWTAGELLAPAVCAVASFALAVTALLGQNAFTIGIGSVLDSLWSSQGNAAYYASSLGVAILIQFGVVLLLARRAFDAPAPWQRLLARAAVLVAGIAAIGGVLAVVGGLLS